jgi:hypothetical protein
MRKAVFIVLILMITISTEAQTRKNRLRIFGGPEVGLITNLDDANLNKVRLGTTAGVEFLHTYVRKKYVFIGLNYSHSSLYRSQESTSLTENRQGLTTTTSSIEVPVGLGFNITKKFPEGMFWNIAMVNNFAISSKSYITTKNLDLEVNSRTLENPIAFYNLGAKTEVGWRFVLKKRGMCAASLGVKPMFWNIIEGKGTKTTSWSTYLTIGYVL